MGLSLAGVLHYFKSKEELLAAVLKHRDDADIPWFYEQWDATGSFAESLRQLVLRNLANPGVMRLFVTLSIESTDPGHPAHEFFRDRYRHSRMIFTEAVERAIERGELRPGSTGPLLIAVLDGLQVRWLLDPEFDLLAEFEHYLDSITLPVTHSRPAVGPDNFPAPDRPPTNRTSAVTEPAPPAASPRPVRRG